MKKLTKLTKLKLAKSAEILEDYEMKQILGGYSAKGCGSYTSSCSGSCGTWNSSGQTGIGICELVMTNPHPLCVCVEQSGG